MYSHQHYYHHLILLYHRNRQLPPLFYHVLTIYSSYSLFPLTLGKTRQLTRPDVPTARCPIWTVT